MKKLMKITLWIDITSFIITIVFVLLHLYIIALIASILILSFSNIMYFIGLDRIR